MKNIITIICFLIAFYECSFAQGNGYALLFDGVDDYVDYGDSPVYHINTGVTYELWIRPDTTAAGFILNKWVGFQEDIQFTFLGGTFSFYLYNVFGGTPLYSASAIPLHQYSHIAATYDGSVANLYINGVLDTSKNVSSFPGYSSGSFYMGFNPVRTEALLPFKGVIDEFRIWNTARTESEIQSTMHQELNGNEPGLIGYWNFNEGTDTTTFDQTGNGNDGAISGATWVLSGAVLPVEDVKSSPNEFELSQNYPNPFNPTTKISWRSTVSGKQTLKIFDVLGNEVTILVDGYIPAGVYEVEFDGIGLTSGIYFYRLQTGSFIETKKMLLIK